MDQQIHVSAQIAERFPTYRGLVLFAYNFTNGASDERSRTLLRDAEAHARAAFAEQPLTEHPHIKAWREAYKAFGVKPQKMLNSAEALIARVLKGSELPAINRLVDVYNAVSVRFVIPCGGEDLAHIQGDVTLRFADGNESFETVKEGQPVIEHPAAGEVIWADQAGVTCRAWNWRQCTRTRLTETTTNAYFLLDSLAPFSAATLQQAGDKLSALLQEFAPGCTVKRFVIE